MEAVKNGLSFFERLQLEPGNWACEYGGPMFLIPGMVVTLYVTGMPLTQPERTEMIRYLFKMQNLGSKNGGDGGWGLHVEADSSVFGTAMNYTALRLLGVPSTDPRMRKARGALYDLGGAEQGPHWTKAWLSILGVMKWEIVNPVPPEFWLLPDWVPFAPWRWWVHMRQVYLPMSFIWSRRWIYPAAEYDPLIKELRQELFVRKYEELDWAEFRNSISTADNYHPKSWILNLANAILVALWIPFLRAKWLVKWAEDWAFQLIQIEDANTDFANLGPVNGPMNLLACYIREGPDAESVRRHRERIQDFLWMSKDGYLMNGTNGVQTWDTAFAIQAVVAAGLGDQPQYHKMLSDALGFLEDQQFIEDSRGYMSSSAFSDPPTSATGAEVGYRQARKGAWGFSNRDQGYTVSDCTAEAMKSVIMLQSLSNQSGTGKAFAEALDFERLRWAADIILTMQNDTGGVASYEPRRGSELIEYLNAAEVFGRIMVEYDYPECTTACVTGLHAFSKAYPHYRQHDIDVFIGRAVEWIRKDQRPDGSWYGSWGICFTYAGMFALESLATQGEVWSTSERVKRACNFLITKQNEDGGWGESYKSCETNVWCDHPDGSQVVQTAWVSVLSDHVGVVLMFYRPYLGCLRLAILNGLRSKELLG